MNARTVDPEGGNIPTNLRMLIILEEIARVGTPITPTTVNAKIGLPKPTIHRLFATLEAEGFLQRELDGRSYSAGHRLRKLSVNVLSSLQVRTARLTMLAAMADEIGETCNIAVPDRNAMVYLDRVETKWPLRIQFPVGTRVPLHCTASGKMYLASLTEAHFEHFLDAAQLSKQTPATITKRAVLREEIKMTRERGYAQDAEEFIEDMIAIAVPINDDQDRLVSTLSFHAPKVRLSLEAAHVHIDRLNRTAKELAQLALQ